MGDDEAAQKRRASRLGYSGQSQTEANSEENQLEVDSSFKGPTSHRKCTDVLWLIFIIAHWVAATYLGFVGLGWIQSKKIGQGAPGILTNWVDHNGYICGKDGHGGKVANKKYLYFVNPMGRLDNENPLYNSFYFKVKAGPNEDSYASSAYGVCVSACPDSGDAVYDYTSCTDADVCDEWTAYDSSRFVNYCLPTLPDIKLSDDSISETSNELFDFFQELGADIIATRVPLAVTGIVLPFVAGFLYMIMLRIPGVLCTLVWGSVALVQVLFLALGYVLYRNYKELKNVDDDMVDKENDEYEKASLYASYVVYIMAALFFCFICCMRRAINLAMGIVKEASSAVNEMKAIVLLPFVQSIGIVVFVVIWFVYVVYVATAGKKKLIDTDAYGKLDMPYTSYDISDNQFYALWYLLFDAFWTVEFIAALGQLVAATAAASWYFTRDKDSIGTETVVSALSHSLKYHAGTCAFGSFIIGLIKWIKAVFLYVQRKVEAAMAVPDDGNPVSEITKKIARVIFCAMQCCLWCLEKCMKFLNKEAYIQTAIFGFPFCKAARKGFFLVLRNVRRVAALESVGNFIFFITKIMISATCALACYVWLGAAFREETYSIVWPTAFCACVAYNLGAIFVGVVDMVADTILICFIADEEIYGANSGDCFATPTLRKYIERHPEHKEQPIGVGSDKF